MGKSGELLAVNISEDQPKLTFWTVEADPKEDVEASKQRLKTHLLKDTMLQQSHVARELSKRGYHHFHVVTKFKNKVRYGDRVKKMQQFMKFEKPNGKEIRVSHCRNH